METNTVSTVDAAAAKEARRLARRAAWVAARRAEAGASGLSLARLAHGEAEFALVRGEQVVAHVDYITRMVDAERFGWVVRSTAVLPAAECGKGRHQDFARLCVRLAEHVPAPAPAVAPAKRARRARKATPVSA